MNSPLETAAHARAVVCLEAFATASGVPVAALERDDIDQSALLLELLCEGLQLLDTWPVNARDGLLASIRDASAELAQWCEAVGLVELRLTPRETALYDDRLVELVKGRVSVVGPRTPEAVR